MSCPEECVSYPHCDCEQWAELDERYRTGLGYGVPLGTPSFDSATRREFYHEGHLVRWDGPAIEDRDGTVEWYCDGTPSTSDVLVLIWIHEHHPEHTPEQLDALTTAARTWAFGTDLDTLYAAVTAATR